MTMLMIEGFEQIDPAITMTASQFQYLFLANEPDVVTGWFGGAGDGVAHHASGRVSGNCLRFTRGANASPSWAADTGANLGFSFTPKQKATLGWASKWSVAPTQPIPLAGFRYDAGSGDEEQISLWATADGKLYISTTSYAALYDDLVVGINPLAVTPSGAFRFTQWTYFEFVVNYEGTTPTVSVRVNGVLVLDGLLSDTFMQLADDPYISSAHVFNATIQHFGNVSVIHSIDDLYIDDANTHGPQWIVGLDNESSTLNEGWDGVPPANYTTAFAGVQGDDWGDQLAWNLSDPPVGVGTVTAIGVNMIGDQSATIDAVEFGVVNASNGGKRSKLITLSAGDPPRCLRFCTQTAPTGLSMTGASLANLRGYLVARAVIT